MPEPEMTMATQDQLDELANLKDHELVDHLINYKKLDPASDAAQACETLRGCFQYTGHVLVNRAKRTPDRTVAIRKIHEACMAAIAALVLNAD